MKLSRYFLALGLVLALAACDDKEPPGTNDTSSTTTDTGSSTTTDTGSSTTADSTSSTVTKITLGVYMSDGAGGYTKGPEELVLTVGESCQTWSRTTKDDGDHYNAADNVAYSDGEVTWVEYGPENSQADIDATCAAGQGGADKWANHTDYAPATNSEDNAAFLKIESVE